MFQISFISYSFRKLLFSILLCVLTCSIKADEASKVIPCESIEIATWLVGTVNTCHMKRTTKIEASGVSISIKDESVKAIDFDGNKNIRFLPERPAENFPDLLMYDARACSIKAISKENFKGLGKLRRLFLINNHIKKVDSNTFEDLQSLEVLWLSE